MKRSGFKRTNPTKASKRPLGAAKKKKTRKVPTLKITTLKKKLWEECKRITRERHGNVCYTCYKQGLSGGNWQTGHYIPSSVCSVELRYDLGNLRPQCYHCNINLSGNWIEYENHLRSEMGENYPEYLKQRNEATKGQMFDILWYEKKLAEYRIL